MRVTQVWERLNTSLWFIPGVATIVSIIAAFTTVEIDRRFLDPELVQRAWLLFDVGADGARATLSAIAQSVITVTGVVFSVTIVALQLAATQFSPRVLRTFLTDRANQIVLAIFIGTFTYTLLVERTVGTPIEGGNGFVPSISVTISIGLSLVSIGALIFFINHIAQSIRASSIIRHVTEDARELIDELFPEPVGQPAAAAPTQPLPEPTVEGRIVKAESAGYLQGIDEDALFSLAEDGRAVIRMEPPIGEFVLPGEPLATVWFEEETADRPDPEKLDTKIRAAFDMGTHSTLGQDLERALVELTDIAVRALSPSLNDPTTAAQCVDRLGELYTRLGTRADPAVVRTGKTGRIRLIAKRLSWERAVELGFEKIRHYGSRAPAVVVRMLQVCGRVRAMVPPERRAVLERQIEDILKSAREAITHESDLRRIENVAEEALRPLV